MPITHVSSAGANSVGGVTSREITRTPGAIGNLLICSFLVSQPAATPTINDTAGNTWTVCNTLNQDGTNNTSVISWWALANGTSSTIVTVQSNAAAQFCSIALDEFTGVHQIAPLDQHVESADGASGTPTSPSITPSVDNCLLWAFAADSITDTANIDGTKATKGSDDGNMDWSEYRILVGRSGISMTAAFAGSGAYNVMAASFKPPTPGPRYILGTH